MERATESYAQFRNKRASPTTDLKLDLVPEDKPLAEELAMFGGQTRVMPAKLSTRKRTPKRSMDESSSSRMSPSHTASTPSDEAMSPRVSDDLKDVHPSVMEYLSLFPQSSSSGSSVGVESPSAASVSSMPAMSSQVMPGMPDVISQETMQFLNSLPTTMAHEMPLEDPSTFFSVNSDLPMTMDLYNMSFMPGEMGVGDQWQSLMRETGIFDQSNMEISTQTATSMTAEQFDLGQTTPPQQQQSGTTPFAHSGHLHNPFVNGFAF